jgi:hypothetical protein
VSSIDYSRSTDLAKLGTGIFFILVSLPLFVFYNKSGVNEAAGNNYNEESKAIELQLGAISCVIIGLGFIAYALIRYCYAPLIIIIYYKHQYLPLFGNRYLYFEDKDKKFESLLQGFKAYKMACMQPLVSQPQPMVNMQRNPSHPDLGASSVIGVNDDELEAMLGRKIEVVAKPAKTGATKKRQVNAVVPTS